MEKNYAIIENGKVVNAIVATPEYAAQYGYVLLPEGFGIGDFFTHQIVVARRTNE